jgi:hypothetical protein
MTKPKVVIARSALVRRSPPSGEGGCDEAIHLSSRHRCEEGGHGTPLRFPSYGPGPWQSKALPSVPPLESKATCFGGLAESQSVTIAAQDNGPLPPKAGPVRWLILPILSLLILTACHFLIRAARGPRLHALLQSNTCPWPSCTSDRRQCWTYIMSDGAFMPSYNT